MKKALTVQNVQNQNISRIPFGGQFYDAFRQPQDKGVWLIYGDSGGGKSYFIMQLAKEFAKYEKVFYNLREEEIDDSDFIERTETLNMSEVKDNFLVQNYDYADCVTYLEKRNSPKVVVIDSATYFFSNFEQYKNFKSQFSKKIILITAHAEGKKPRTDMERSINYNAKQKIFVSAYAAYCKGRTIGPNGGLFIIWKEGYEKARGSQLINEN